MDSVHFVGRKRENEGGFIGGEMREGGLALGHVLYVDLSFGMEKNRFSFSSTFSHKSPFLCWYKKLWSIFHISS